MPLDTFHTNTPGNITRFASLSFAVDAPTRFLWLFAVVFLCTVFGANSNFFLQASFPVSLMPHPTPPITSESARLSLTACTLQIYLLYLVIHVTTPTSRQPAVNCLTLK